MESLKSDELVPPDVAPQVVWFGVEPDAGAGGMRVFGVDPPVGGTLGGAAVQATTARLRRIAVTPTRERGPSREGWPGRARSAESAGRHARQLVLEPLETPIGVSSSRTGVSWIHARRFRSIELYGSQRPLELSHRDRRAWPRCP